MAQERCYECNSVIKEVEPLDAPNLVTYGGPCKACEKKKEAERQNSQTIYNVKTGTLSTVPSL